jgi:uncharacterized membrane protein YadS
MSKMRLRTSPLLSDPKILFLLGLVVASSGVIPPPAALAAGFCYALLATHPRRAESARTAKLLLQFSVVLLGFGINLAVMLKAGSSGFVYTAVSIAATLLVGLLLGRFFKVLRRASLLVTVVGASAKFGMRALQVGTTVKLARALWILPVSLVVAAWPHRRKDSGSQLSRVKIKVPWFIFVSSWPAQ